MASAGSRKLGNQIVRRLEDLERRQADLARRLEVDPSIIQLWCRDKRAVPENRFDGLAQALALTVDELLTGWTPFEVVAERERQRLEQERQDQERAACEEAEREAAEREQAERAAQLAQEEADLRQREAEHGTWQRNPLPSHALWPMVGATPIPGRPTGDWVAEGRDWVWRAA